MTRLALSLALALASPLLALAQDAPPADLLAHVKPGQRWVFVMSVGTSRIEETMAVVEVVPAEGKVLYLSSTTVSYENGGSTTSVPGALDEWTWGSSPVRQNVALPEVSSERTKLEVPGIALDVFVWRIGKPPEQLESKVAVKGDLETFPGLVSTGAGGQLTRSLVRVTTGPVPARPPAPAELVAHVRVGQRWTFRAGDVAGNQATIVRTITSVSPVSGDVTYDERTESKGEEPGVDEAQAWTAGQTVPTVTGPETRTESKRLEVPGMKLDCRVTTTGSGEAMSSTWVAAKDGHELFPGPVKLTQGTTTTLELVKVE